MTHDPVEARRLGDRMIVMRDGRASAAVDLRSSATTIDLQRRLIELGPEALIRQLEADGADAMVAGLAVAALQAGLPPVEPTPNPEAG